MSIIGGGDDSDRRSGTVGAQPTLPLLLAALPCDQVLQDVDGTVSVIRTIDQVRVRAEGRDAPKTMPLTHLRQAVLLSFLSGDYVGAATLTLRWQAPDEKVRDLVTQEIVFQGANHKINVIGRLHLDTDQVGLHWFDVVINGHRMSRFAIDIDYGIDQGLDVTPRSE